MLLGELKLTTANVLSQLGNVIFCKAAEYKWFNIQCPTCYAENIFALEVKKKKIVSLDHCLPVESMPLTRPTDKREDTMWATGTAVQTHDPYQKCGEIKVSVFILAFCHCPLEHLAK